MNDTWKAAPTDAWKPESPRPDADGSDPTERGRPDRLWPTLIVAGLLVVVMVNAAFIWIAVDGADEVVPSYMEEER